MWPNTDFNGTRSSFRGAAWKAASSESINPALRDMDSGLAAGAAPRNDEPIGW